jgi:hypothetical protein
MEKKNILAENMRRFGTKNLNEDLFPLFQHQTLRSHPEFQLDWRCIRSI